MKNCMDTCKGLELKMEFSNNMSGSAEADLKTDCGFDLSAAFRRRLDGGRLAERMMEAVRLAVAQDMFLQAQEMQSAVEAEYSTDYPTRSLIKSETTVRVRSRRAEDGSDSTVV